VRLCICVALRARDGGHYREVGTTATASLGPFFFPVCRRCADRIVLGATHFSTKDVQLALLKRAEDQSIAWIMPFEHMDSACMARWGMGGEARAPVRG
jgi:hypothetical protein